MKLINKKLRDKIWSDLRDKVNEHAPYGNPVRTQIEKNFGMWDDDLNRLKVHNPKLNIRNDLDETT